MQPGMAAHAFSPNPGEAEAFLSEFQVSLVYYQIRRENVMVLGRRWGREEGHVSF